jgi:hypothetical protein
MATQYGMESIQQILYGSVSVVLGTLLCVTISNKKHLI